MDKQMCKTCDESVDVHALMDVVIHDEPLTELERKVILASLMLWQLVPPHTRDAVLDDHIQSMKYNVAPATTVVN